MEQPLYKSCVVCGGTDTRIWSRCKDFEYRTSDEIYTYYKCNSCVTIFIDPMPVSKISEIYPSNYYSFSDIKKNLAVQVKEYLDQLLFKKILSKIRSQSINVLDVGGGSGWLLNIIRKIDSRVGFTQVVDIDEKAKALAEKNGHHYFHGTIEEFQSDKKFDLILMLNLVEHISDPGATLVKMEKILNKGGLILIKTPNIESLDARLFQKSYWGGLHCPRHWILFSQNSFRKLVRDSDLSLNYIKYTQGAPFWAWSILIKFQKFGIKITKERPVIFHPMVPFLNLFFAAFDFVRGLFGSKTSQMFIELEKK
jgi:2-polyprenyl-3-methyl-5-hydroxy-6-metoxy-1,4-benzoquinol methylase